MNLNDFLIYAKIMRVVGVVLIPLLYLISPPEGQRDNKIRKYLGHALLFLLLVFLCYAEVFNSLTWTVNTAKTMLDGKNWAEGVATMKSCGLSKHWFGRRSGPSTGTLAVSYKFDVDGKTYQGRKSIFLDPDGMKDPGNNTCIEVGLRLRNRHVYSMSTTERGLNKVAPQFQIDIAEYRDNPTHKVFYNPKNPKENCLERPTIDWWVLLTSPSLPAPRRGDG